MIIRDARPDDRDALLDIWLRSVRATHDFLSPEDVAFFHPLVRRTLSADALEVWVLCDDDGAPAGWMGLAGAKLEALFLAPERRGAGGGRLLVERARAERGPLSVDVNEQNVQARAFYERLGFVVEGRSPVDGTGRPFPLLHLRG